MHLLMNCHCLQQEMHGIDMCAEDMCADMSQGMFVGGATRICLTSFVAGP